MTGRAQRHVAAHHHQLELPRLEVELPRGRTNRANRTDADNTVAPQQRTQRVRTITHAAEGEAPEPVAGVYAEELTVTVLPQ